jgi:MFS family permease
MVISAGSFIAFMFLPVNFEYSLFAAILFVMGLGNGIFMSPNMASVMNSCPPENRGAASGMRSTLQNVGQTISQAIFFSIIIISLNASLPAALSSAVAGSGASPQVAAAFGEVPASSALFAAFLGYNPINTILQAMGSLGSGLSATTMGVLHEPTFFPNAISGPFMSALTIAFAFAAILCFAAAVCSGLRGNQKTLPSSSPTKAVVTAAEH